MAARRPRAERTRSYPKGDHDHGNIRFHLAHTLINANTPEVKSSAWEGEFVAIIPDADHYSLFHTAPVFVNLSQQSFSHLTDQEAADDDVIIYHIRQLSFHDVFTNLTVGTLVSNSRSASSLADGFVNEVMCTQ
jgi:hypothetical protein